MIHVLASISIRSGQRERFLEVFKTLTPKVLQEKGCIEYNSAVDIDAKLPIQLLDENIVTIIEKWETLEALQAHLKVPHYLDYREKVKDLVDGRTLKVLTDS